MNIDFSRIMAGFRGFWLRIPGHFARAKRMTLDWGGIDTPAGAVNKSRRG